MAVEFNYEHEKIEGGIDPYDLLQWIGDIHTELTDAGVLPDGVSTETHQQLMILAKEAEEAARTGNYPRY